jgi:hypothetical protein
VAPESSYERKHCTAAEPVYNLLLIGEFVGPIMPGIGLEIWIQRAIAKHLLHVDRARPIRIEIV